MFIKVFDRSLIPYLINDDIDYCVINKFWAEKIILNSSNMQY